MRNFHDKIIANWLRKALEVNALRAEKEKNAKEIRLDSYRAYTESQLLRMLWLMVSAIDTLLFFNIIFWLSVSMRNLHMNFPFDILLIRPKELAILIIAAVPILFNYFSIFFKGRYEKLLKTYDGNNRKLLIIYMFVVMGLIIIPAVTVVLVHVLNN